jgi:hypothetical protein
MLSQMAPGGPAPSGATGAHLRDRRPEDADVWT